MSTHQLTDTSQIQAQKNPTAAMLVIGDEILSGRTRDSNLHHIAKVLVPYGIDLQEARVVADHPDAIIHAVQSLSQTYSYVFTSGGIGPTHDDITAECIAKAFGVSIDIRSDVKEHLENYYRAQGKTPNRSSLRMARIPEEATLIDNPVSGAPGFKLNNVCVMAGIPKIFEAMLEGLLPTLEHGSQVHSDSIRILRGEGAIAHIMSEISDRYAGLSVGSYPFQEDGQHGTNIVLRSQSQAELGTAKTELEQKLSE